MYFTHHESWEPGWRHAQVLPKSPCVVGGRQGLHECGAWEEAEVAATEKPRCLISLSHQHWSRAARTSSLQVRACALQSAAFSVLPRKEGNKDSFYHAALWTFLFFLSSSSTRSPSAGKNEFLKRCPMFPVSPDFFSFLMSVYFLKTFWSL